MQQHKAPLIQRSKGGRAEVEVGYRSREWPALGLQGKGSQSE